MSKDIVLDLVVLFALSISCFGGTWLSIYVCAIVWLVMGSWKDRFNWEYRSETGMVIASVFVLFLFFLVIVKRHPNITDLGTPPG